MKRIMVTGAGGFLGRAVLNELVESGHLNITPLVSQDGDLRDRQVVDKLIKTHKPNIIIHLAARVGGIGANMERPGDFFYDNIMMGVNLIDSAAKHAVEKLVQVGTVCSYPKMTPVPFIEEELWNGYPEETNAPYGIAKKALLVMGQAYRKQYSLNSIYLIPVNLYGPGDNFSPITSHVIPALMLKIAEANIGKTKNVEVWGTGDASREFLYVTDCAVAIRKAMELYDGSEPVNIGSGQEITIEELVYKLCHIMGYNGEVVWDSSKPDGQPRRCLNTHRARQQFGFAATISLDEGLRRTVDYFYNGKSNTLC